MLYVPSLLLSNTLHGMFSSPACPTHPLSRPYTPNNGIVALREGVNSPTGTVVLREGALSPNGVVVLKEGILFYRVR